MGYTHYFPITKQPTQDQWNSIAAGVKKALDIGGVPVAFEYDSSELPVIDKDLIRFNGIAEDGHETFYLSREDSGFQFCKTAYKPYDTLVTASLLIAEHFAPDCYNISSDGEASDWEAGKDLAEKACGVEMVIGL